MIGIIQMVARRRWGIETQNNSPKYYGILTHKYDSRVNAPFNFMYLMQLADLMRMIPLNSDIYDQMAKTAESYPMPYENSKSGNAPKEADDAKDMTNIAEPLRADDCQKASEKTDEPLHVIHKIQKMRKKAVKTLKPKCWSSVAEWCSAVKNAMKCAMSWCGETIVSFKMRWEKLEHCWNGILHWV